MTDMHIVILTKNFGYNFTGATVATHTLIQKWVENENVKYVTVLTLNVDEYCPHNKLRVEKIGDPSQLRNKAMKLNRSHTIFYSDDHLGYILKGLPYVHTYHGNWPDARFISMEMFLKSFYFIDRYRKTITNAAVVVNVSQYMEKFTNRFNKKSIVIRNGVSQAAIAKVSGSLGNKVLMIGTIEPRKYRQVLKLLKVLPQDIRIDAYGNIADRKLAEELNSFPNFTVKGFTIFQDIPLNQYACFLSLSTMENMPISLVEVLRSGIPVIAYAVGGIPEIVNDDCGVLFQKNADINQISITIQDILKSRRTFNMSNKMLEQFDWEIASREYLKVFEKVLNDIGAR